MRVAWLVLRFSQITSRCTERFTGVHDEPLHALKELCTAQCSVRRSPWLQAYHLVSRGVVGGEPWRPHVRLAFGLFACRLASSIAALSPLACAMLLTPWRRFTSCSRKGMTCRTGSKTQGPYSGGAMDEQWTTNGGAMDDQWTTNGGAMEEQWKTNGRAMDEQWRSNGRAMDDQWTSNGRAMDDQWRSN